jgi:hypothetical protein
VAREASEGGNKEPRHRGARACACCDPLRELLTLYSHVVDPKALQPACRMTPPPRQVSPHTLHIAPRCVLLLDNSSSRGRCSRDRAPPLRRTRRNVVGIVIAAAAAASGGGSPSDVDVRELLLRQLLLHEEARAASPRRVVRGSTAPSAAAAACTRRCRRRSSGGRATARATAPVPMRVSRVPAVARVAVALVPVAAASTSARAAASRRLCAGQHVSNTHARAHAPP